MSLKEKLEAQKAGSASRIPPNLRAIMEKATTDLRASGILQKMTAVGQMAPSFSAPNYDGNVVSSKDLLSRGPILLSFFRGGW